MDWQWAAILVLSICVVWLSIVCYLQDKEIEEALNKARGAVILATEAKQGLGMRDGKVVEAITSDLDAELERSAMLTEARKARRTTLERENAGPPATVRKMKFRR